MTGDAVRGPVAGPDVATGPFGGLQEQLLGAAEQFGSGPVAQILSGMVEDVDRALREPLEIFPVCHHSPSSATAMARRLHEKRPKVIYLELCEDLRPLLKELRHCRPPVALQAFATDVDGFPAEWVPLSVVAPITEASAEYQAIAYALTTPGVELVLVDRSADHVFQWERRDAGQRHRNEDEEALHGDAVGVEIGDLRPRFTELEEHLLHHGKVRHWSEWWDQYVEQPLINADYDTYRQVMVLIGSLFRRLRPEDAARTVVDEKRERYMWTRIRQHLASSGADPADCLYVCGAFHAASRVEEFGLHGRDGSFEIPPRTATSWQYGLIPSSHSAIEAQFGLAPGSVSIAAATWTKALRRTGVAPFRLGGASTTKKSAKAIRSVEAMEPAAPVTDRLAPLGLDLEKHTRQRALLDLNTDPHLQPCSDLLWILRRLLGCDAVQPIMGSRRLGERSIQESWDLAIGRHMQSIIELGYEGVTAEQVFQQRLRKAVHAPKATAAFALAAVEDSLCYLRSRRFADALGARAVELLAAERTVDDAPEVLRRARRLLAYYQTTDSELPEWLQAFVTAGYAHYCTLLPIAFADDDAGARQVAAMLGFLLGMEGLALSLGCDRTRLEPAVQQSHPEHPAKVALLWAAQTQLGLLSPPQLRRRCDELLDNPLVVPSFPLYLSGLVQALEPVPALTSLVVEVLSKTFTRLPDTVLLPWLPKLITTLRDHAAEMVPVLVREAGRTFPATLPELDSWIPPWSASQAPTPAPSRAEAGGGPAGELLAAHPAACDAAAALLGLAPDWSTTTEPGTAPEVTALLSEHPGAAEAPAVLVGRSAG